MRFGFYDKNTNERIPRSQIESELPEIFMHDSMKEYQHPKTEYLSVLGVAACGGSIYIDLYLLERIIGDTDLYEPALEYLCTKYNFQMGYNDSSGI